MKSWILIFLSASCFAATHTVKSGSSIQSALEKAKSGDTVEVYPGVYTELILMDKENVRLIGKLQNGEWPTLDGSNKKNDGIIASGSNLEIAYFKIKNFKGNGVTTQGADHVRMHHLIVENTGLYGIYPTRGSYITIEDTVTSGIADAGIYVGMCSHVEVRRNEVFNNVAGIEIENSEHVIVEDNYAHNNTGGILAFTLPGLPVKHSDSIILRRNIVESNNHDNFGAPSSTVGSLPPGTGMVVLAGNNVQIEDNIIRNNVTGGLILSDMSFIDDMSAPDPEVDPKFKNIKVYRNLFYENGKKPRGKMVKLLLAVKHLSLSGGDIITNGDGKDNCLFKGLGANVIGAKDFTECKEGATTKDVVTVLATSKELTSVQKARSSDLGTKVYNNVCAGCHASNISLIGPPLQELQKKYHGNARGIVEFAFAPSKIRSKYPAMPSQNYLGKEKLQAAAEFILKVKTN